jgi:hypothetical protein
VSSLFGHPQGKTFGVSEYTNPFFLKWALKFHVHIDALVISLRVILMQPSEGKVYHPIYFTSRTLSKVEHNYTSTKREGLEMATPLQKFRD